MPSITTAALVVLLASLLVVAPVAASVGGTTGGVAGVAGVGAGEGGEGEEGDESGAGGGDSPDGSATGDGGGEGDAAQPGDGDPGASGDDDGGDGNAGPTDVGRVGDDPCRFALVLQGGRLQGERTGFDGDARAKLDSLARMGYDDDGETGSEDVDDDAEVVNLVAPTDGEFQDAVDALRERIAACEAAGRESELLVFATGHGWELRDADGSGVIDRGFLLRDGSDGADVLYPEELAAILGDLRAAGLDEAYAEFSSCYSGSFVGPLSDVSDGTATAASEDGLCDGAVQVPGDRDDGDDDYLASTFETTFLAALTGGWPGGSRARGLPRGTPEPSTADADGDGNVTWAEAFAYADRAMDNSSSSDDPQWGGPCEDCRYVPPGGPTREGDAAALWHHEPLDGGYVAFVGGPRFDDPVRYPTDGAGTPTGADERAGSAPTPAPVDPGTLPGSLAYPVDRFGERLELVVAIGPRATSRVHLRHAAERLAEARALAGGGRDGRVGRALGDYATSVGGARSTLAAHEASAGRAEVDRRHLLAAVAGHESVLAALAGHRGAARAAEARTAAAAWSADGSVRLADPTRQLLEVRLRTAGPLDGPLPDGDVDVLVRDPSGTAVASLVVVEGHVVAVRDGPSPEPVATASLSSATARELLAADDPALALGDAIREGRVEVTVDRLP